MEAQNKHLEEKQQRQPDIKIINEGWGIKFGQAREQIVYLMKENKKKIAELKEMSAQLQDKKATIEVMQWDLQDIGQKNQELRGKLVEALEIFLNNP